MEKENFKKGVRFTVARNEGSEFQTPSSVFNLPNVSKVWVCVEVAPRLVVAVDEKRATHRLRKRYGSEDDVVPTHELARMAHKFDEFLILWEHEFLFCKEISS